MLGLLKLLLGIAVLIGSQYLLVKYGEPQAVWLYCEILELCEAGQ